MAASCVDEDDNNNIINGPNALDFVNERESLSLFGEALLATNLDETIAVSNNLTIFAPNNTAFTQFLAANNFASLSDVPEDMLRTIILYHIQNEVKSTEQFRSQYFKTLADVDGSQMDVFVNAATTVTVNGEAQVIVPDNTVSNGIVHIVDDVLDLPSVVTLLAANPDFSLLVSALEQQGLSITLDEIDDAAAPFTIFAPSDPAINAFIAADDTDAIEDFQDFSNQDDLDDQLLYHVLANQRLRLEDFVDGAVIEPLGEGTFMINTSSGFTILDGAGKTTNIITTNVTAFNGIIHSLDFFLQAE
jgi:uncharacterized surface protein with fasciclin (FAS1) repeats